jgi:hypothetical protein
MGAAWNGMGTAWYVSISLKPARIMYRLLIGIKLKVNSVSCWPLLRILPVQGAYKLSEDFAKPYFHKY